MTDSTTSTLTQPVHSGPMTLVDLEQMIQTIDTNIASLMEEGALASAKYTASGPTTLSVDREAALKGLLNARTYYAGLRDKWPEWQVS
jgi:hypothetical protein